MYALFDAGRCRVTGELPEFGWVGQGLNRPECVLTHRSGWTFAASWEGKGGVTAIAPDGRASHHLARTAGPPVRPNGVALEPEGTFLLAHLGADDGGVHRLHPDGALEPVLTEVAGRPIPPSNFPAVDNLGRLWLSVSTTVVPRARDYNPNATTGMIILKDHRGARVVADDLGYANEFIVSADCRALYVNETFRRRLVRYEIAADGALQGPEVIVAFGPGDFPDGLAMDADGGFWVTSIVSNRLIHIDADGWRTTFLISTASGAACSGASPAWPSAGRTSGPAISAACSATASPRCGCLSQGRRRRITPTISMPSPGDSPRHERQ
jgi:sugar lactone lactonase YvrE